MRIGVQVVRRAGLGFAPLLNGTQQIIEYETTLVTLDRQQLERLSSVVKAIRPAEALCEAQAGTQSPAKQQ